MNKAEFLAALAAEIRDLSREDIARSLEYYSEMIDEKVEEGLCMEDAVASLGSPEEIGQEIIEALPKERNAFSDRPKADFAKHIETVVRERIDQAMATGREGSPKPKMGTYEYRFAEPFEAIDIRVDTSDVRLMRSAGTEALVVSRRTEDCPETVEVKDGILTIRQSPSGSQSSNGFRLFGLSFNIASESDSMTIYLPEQTFKNIQVSGKSGDLEMEDICCETAAFTSISGDIEGRHIIASAQLNMETMSGDIQLRDLKGTGMSLRSMSGDIHIVQGETESLAAESKSGDITLENVLTKGLIRAESMSGDVKLHRSDAETLELRSASGDIQATLLSGKAFDVHSSVGEVRVPECVTGAGECRAYTSSGDIRILLAP